MTPRISCEGCHGAGEKHVTLMKSKVPQRKGELAIMNPGHFDTEGQSQFCGSCHHSWIQVQMMGMLCPKSKENCVSCHMPKTQIPDVHFKFTDHQIRIVRKDDPYPN